MLYPPLRYLSPVLFSLFCILIYKARKVINARIIWLTILWLSVPLLVFSAYNGEISGYYFSINRITALVVLSTISAFFAKNNFFRLTLLIGVAVIYGYYNVQYLRNHQYNTFQPHRNMARYAVYYGINIPFGQGDAVSYLYNMYLFKKMGVWP